MKKFNAVQVANMIQEGIVDEVLGGVCIGGGHDVSVGGTDGGGASDVSVDDAVGGGAHDVSVDGAVGGGARYVSDLDKWLVGYISGVGVGAGFVDRSGGDLSEWLIGGGSGGNSGERNGVDLDERFGAGNGDNMNESLNSSNSNEGDLYQLDFSDSDDDGDKDFTIGSIRAFTILNDQSYNINNTSYSPALKDLSVSEIVEAGMEEEPFDSGLTSGMTSQNESPSVRGIKRMLELDIDSIEPIDPPEELMESTHL